MTLGRLQMLELKGLRVLAPEAGAAEAPARVLFTTRLGGTSQVPYESLNLGFHVGDRPADVLANRRRLLSALGVELRALTCAEQVHGDVVVRVGPDEVGRGAIGDEDSLPRADALITDVPGAVLGLFFADCVPIALVDPVSGAVGVAHAGRQGILLDIPRAIVEGMRGEFGSSPRDLEAFIGPSIERDCYEIDEKTAGRFSERYPEHIGAVLRGRFLDLPGLAARQLLSSGVLPNNITSSGLCTRCRTDLFFSHRGEGGTTGRHAALVALLEEPIG